ncbi:ABC transporter permease [Syntrophobacter fumaroxidans]|uniref:Binding-protein-dependent transport systems inner membrane component n=1 Tax=Syntrophobacter fumaroxidans (strain DSM 10017 / MPOB) TaxID=335543 RepID=A0LKE6_SYNFM|nr:ABC transporter permease [Syntrophobacter fumaroxidans]ABK17898.1 binding-protein-dependent transport systems inner membrane component [Syntrophobacter fumaroxidans MPOB]
MEPTESEGAEVAQETTIRIESEQEALGAGKAADNGGQVDWSNRIGAYREYSALEKFLRRSVRGMFNYSNLRKILSLVIIVILWQLVTTYKIPPFTRVPSPNEVWKEAVAFIPSTHCLMCVIFSMGRIYLGFMIACLIGIPLGLMMGWNRTFKNFTFPTFESLRPIPVISWIPLSVIMFPLTEHSIVFLVFLGAFYPIVLNTLLGVESVRADYIQGALSLGSKPRHIFFDIILPGALPSIFTGMTVGMGLAWVMVVAAEMVAGGYGLGYMTWESYILIAYPRIILGMFIIGACGYLSSTVLRYLATKAMPWRSLF